MLDVMPEPSTDLLQGTLDLLILKTLALEPMHGFGIARRIEQVSEGVFRVNPGSLLVANLDASLPDAGDVHIRPIEIVPLGPEEDTGTE